MNTKHLRLASAILLAQSGLAASVAHAQIEEVIVTAERREASIQDTAIALTALSGETLEELGITAYGDIGDFVPNVVTHEQPGNGGTAVMMRGLKNAETLITFEPKVAVYLDGVLIAKNTGSAFDIVDLERVEVLRGPQGTLYGRNTVGGAINLITKKPYDEFGGKLSATLGNYNQRDLTGTVNVPLIPDTLALKATLATLNRDGYWDNIGTSGDSDIGDKNREAAHIQLQWTPNERVSLLYAYDMTDADEKAVPRPNTFLRESFLPPSLVALLADSVVTDNDFDVSYNFPQIQKLDVEGHNITAEVDLNDNLSLVSITAYRESDNEAWGDSDGTALPPQFGWVRHSIQASEHEMLTEELRLVGSALDDRLEFVAGAFYMAEEGDMLFSNVSPAANAHTIADFQNDIWAVFGEATYALTERLDLTLGVRYTEEEREISKAEYSLPAAQNFPTPGDVPLYSATAGPNKWDDVSGTVSLSYQWNDDLMTYARVAKGYASGGFNVRSTVPAAFTKPYDEETLISYELGWKSTWFDDRLLINGAAFFSDYSDLQVNQFDPETSSNNLDNAGDAEIKGWEVEVRGQISESLEVGGSYGYLDQAYETFIAADGTDLSNSFWAHSPEHSVHAYIRYVLFDAIAGGDLTARVDYMWQDDINFLTFNPLGLGEPNAQEAYDHVNARVTLSQLDGVAADSLSLSLWGKNLTDESWRTTGINYVVYASNSWAPPRTWGVDVSYSF